MLNLKFNAIKLNKIENEKNNNFFLNEEFLINLKS